MTSMAVAYEEEDGVTEAEFHELMEEIAAGESEEGSLEHLPWREVWCMVVDDYWECQGRRPPGQPRPRARAKRVPRPRPRFSRSRRSHRSTGSPGEADDDSGEPEPPGLVAGVLGGGTRKTKATVELDREDMEALVEIFQILARWRRELDQSTESV